MGYIKHLDKTISIQINNILFIKTYDMMTFYNMLLLKKIVIEDGVDFLNEHRSLIISPLTTAGDIFALTKSNILGKTLLENNKEELEKLVSKDTLESVASILSNYLPNVEKNEDFDILKIIQLLYELNLNKLIDKKIFISLMKLFSMTGYTNLLLFNCDWIDDECISLLISNNIKTVLVFNEYSNIKNQIFENTENLLIIDQDGIKHFDQKAPISEEEKENIFEEKIFLKF